MNLIAIKMLIGDRAKYFGILLGLITAAFLITFQTSIFTGFMTRTYSFITDLGLADIWVMDPRVQFIDDTKSLKDTQLYSVRGVAGVQWAVPLYKGLLKAKIASGNFQACNVFGLDESSLIGGPPRMIEGRLADLRMNGAVIVDDVGAAELLCGPAKRPGGPSVPLRVGDTLELNDQRAVVVGICHMSRTFLSQPVIFTTYSRAMSFAPQERKMLSFVLVKALPGQDPAALCQRIRRATGLAAYTRDEFKYLTASYYMKKTGIPINIGIGMVLAFFVGSAITGLMFFNFTNENLRHFGALKAMGARNGVLLRMILLQAAMSGAIGYGVGVGAVSALGTALSKTQMAFRLMPQSLILVACIIFAISMLSASISIRKVMRLEPAIVFKG